MEWLIAQTAELEKGEKAVKDFQHPKILAYAGDSEAHKWKVTVMLNGEPVDLSSSYINAYIRLSSGETVVLSGTGSDSGIAEVIFSDDVYAIGGPIQCVMRASIDTNIVTIGAFTATVMPSITDGPIIDPTGIIPSVEELLTIVEDIVGVYESSLRFDISQSLTSEEKVRALSNLGISESSTNDDLAYILGT